MRGCSTYETKRSEICSVMLGRKLNVLSLSETEVKGKREFNLASVIGRVSGEMNGRAREGVDLLLNKRVLDGVVEYREVYAPLMWRGG